MCIKPLHIAFLRFQHEVRNNVDTLSKDTLFNRLIDNDENYLSFRFWDEFGRYIPKTFDEHDFKIPVNLDKSTASALIYSDLHIWQIFDIEETLKKIKVDEDNAKPPVLLSYVQIALNDDFRYSWTYRF